MRKLRPAGDFCEELVRAGYDPDRPSETYPAAVWREVLEISRRHRFAGLTADRAYRALGHAFLDGFAETLVGRVVCAMLPLIGPERMLISFPRYASMGRPDATIEMRLEGPRRWRAVAHFPLTIPEFTAGVLERGLERTGVEGTVEVENRSEDHFDLLARW
jgi:uncharacterized protein (TIGR02265 family)